MGPYVSKTNDVIGLNRKPQKYKNRSTINRPKTKGMVDDEGHSRENYVKNGYRVLEYTVGDRSMDNENSGYDYKGKKKYCKF